MLFSTSPKVRTCNSIGITVSIFFIFFFFMMVDCGLVGRWDFRFLLLLFFNGGWSESIKTRFLVLHVLLCIWYRQKKLSVLV